MAGANTLEFNDGNFEQDVIGAETPVLVDFWAPWCGPCKALGPVIDELANDYEGRVKVGKLDTDGSQDVAAKFQISSIPTVIVFNNGEIVDRFVGLRSKRDYQAVLDRVLTPA
ncbi:MAG: thioredoxin [Phycisphaerae bacterium]